jgi:putative endonuclease
VNARRRLGAGAEEAAVNYLERLGYRIVERNLRLPGGEIDILARDGETLVFIEVKARSSRAYGSALSAVDARKRRRVRAMAEDYLQYFAPTTKARFDVLAFDGGVMRLYRDAF